MSDDEGVAAEAPVQMETEVTEEDALRGVLKSALEVDGLRRGLHESAKALERQREARLCLLAKDCDSEEYRSLVTALCAAGGIPLLLVESREKLGELVGLVKLDKEGNPRGKTVKCSVAVVTDILEDHHLHQLQKFLKQG